MAKYMILGGNSTLASFFLDKYSNESESFTKKECDITNLKNLDLILEKSKSEYVINCAALTDMKFCEKNPVKCFEVNSLGVLNLSKLCNKYNKKLIHFSSDYAVNPVNIYGYSKYYSEKLVNLNKDLVIRTSFYSPKYFIINSLIASKASKVTPCYKNMFFNPISVTRLVDEIYKNKDRSGIINIFSDQKISKFVFAKMFAKTFKINKKLINPVDFIQKPDDIRLPLNSFVKSDIKINLEEDLSNFILR